MNNTAKNSLPQNIGLALSGGGYRAAVFHLGLLSYLNRVDLLKQVKMISTVSGGTFTGAKYTLSLVEGKSFAEFYQEYYNFLKNTKLVELALKKLNTKASTIPSSRTDLITASAQVYAETFLQNPAGQPYRFGAIMKANIPLQEVIFNATEFRSGLAFRFQRSANSKGKIGNGHISINESDAADIRIADIVAASSCFPGGFEPLAFPRDFHWSNYTAFDNIQKTLSKKISPSDITKKNIDENILIPDAELAREYSQVPLLEREENQDIALMDGGIYDNQGIESLWLADKRNNFILDLLIISDVDQRPGNFYDFPQPIKVSQLTLEQIDLGSQIITLFCVFTLITTGYESIKDYLSGAFIWLDFFLYIIPILLAATTAWILFQGRDIIQKQILPLIPQVGILAWNDLKKLTVNQVVNGIYLRLSSLQAMAGSVFMNRIRQMGFTFIYQQYNQTENNDQGKKPDKNPAKQKIIANLIYKLKTGSQPDKLPGVQAPSNKILKVINAAANMPTTLWFTEDNQLDNLIIAGQVNICYNLMLYITRNYDNNPSLYPDDVKILWDVLVKDWDKFCADPQILS